MKESGLGDNFYVGGYDLSGDVGTISKVSGSISTLAVTGIDSLGEERIGGKRDGAIDFMSFFNPSAGQSHPVLSALPTTDILVSYLRGTSLGGPAASMVAKQVTYDPTRAEDGALTLSVATVSNAYGLEWGTTLTAGKRTDTGATDGTGVDGASSSTHGLQAYLQVMAFTGTDATITIEESSDDGSADAYAAVTGGAFTQVTSGPTTERIATSGTQTIERYLRVATSTSGGFSSITFCVIVVRNLTAVTF